MPWHATPVPLAVIVALVTASIVVVVNIVNADCHLTQNCKYNSFFLKLGIGCTRYVHC